MKIVDIDNAYFSLMSSISAARKAVDKIVDEDDELNSPMFLCNGDTYSVWNDVRDDIFDTLTSLFNNAVNYHDTYAQEDV